MTQTQTESRLGDRMGPGAIMLVATVQTVLFVWAGIGMWWLSGRPPAEFAVLSAEGILLGVAIGILFAAVGAAYFFGARASADRLIVMQGDSYPFLAQRLGPVPIIVLSMCAGIGEEALFRGGMQTLMGDYLPVWIAIALSSALFALMHLSRPLVCFIQFLIGVLFGIIYWKSGSLVAVMIGHGIYDIFALWYVQKRLHELDFFGQKTAEQGE